jgi:hypothetical protein
MPGSAMQSFPQFGRTTTVSGSYRSILRGSSVTFFVLPGAAFLQPKWPDAN